MTRSFIRMAFLCRFALGAAAAAAFAAAAQSSADPEPPALAAPDAKEGSEEGAGRAGREVVAREVSFEPLFDTNTRFKPGKTFKLRFRAVDKRSGQPVPPADISVSLVHQPDAKAELPVRRVKEATYEVPFAPRGPGQYALLVAVRGAAPGSIRPVSLGVVGVVGGGKIVNGPAPVLDARGKQQKGKGR